MNYKINITILLVLIVATASSSCREALENYTSPKNTNMSKETTRIPVIQIILGSTRKARVSDKIGNSLKRMADKRTDISTEIVDLREFNLPFLNDEVAPQKRKEIVDPAVKKWSDKIKEADAYVIVTPEYNSGYPGVLKNALDSLYAEWNSKPVALVGYSGGSSGGTTVLNRLRQVVAALKMKPVSLEIKIPSSWQAFDQQGNFVDKTIEDQLNAIVNQLLAL